MNFENYIGNQQYENLYISRKNTLYMYFYCIHESRNYSKNIICDNVNGYISYLKYIKNVMQKKRSSNQEVKLNASVFFSLFALSNYLQNGLIIFNIVTGNFIGKLFT